MKKTNVNYGQTNFISVTSAKKAGQIIDILKSEKRFKICIPYKTGKNTTVYYIFYYNYR